MYGDARQSIRNGDVAIHDIPRAERNYVNAGREIALAGVADDLAAIGG